jgi:putative ABC transport system ATP-binding protein
VIRRPKNGPSGNAGDIQGPASTHLIDLRSVVKDYVTDAGPFRALDGVDLQVDSGEFISVVGRSGCGKSTLMNMITGIDRATAGVVSVAGQDLGLMSEGRTAVWRGRTVGVIFQFFQLLPTLTVVENVMLPMDFGGLWTPRERYDRAMSLLERVGMADQARKLPSSTSGGQQQRVAVARALANDPPLLVADEPTGNLDSATADVVFELFEAFVEQGRTIVTVTHDTELAKRTRRTVHMADGQILDGSLDEDAAVGAGARIIQSAPIAVAVGDDVAATEASEGTGA